MRASVVSLMGMLILSQLATGQDRPAAWLLPPIRGTTATVDSSRESREFQDPDDNPPDLPPRAASLRLRREDAAPTRLSRDQIQPAQHTTRPARDDAPLRGDEIFNYLADGRPRTRPSQREPIYETPRSVAPPSEGWYPGKKLNQWFGKNPEDHQGLFFCSDHEFESLISPVTNPFLFEDPRAMSELRPLFFYQTIPNGQPNFQGGDLWHFGLQGRIALTEKLSLVIHKLGITELDARNPAARSGSAFAELWLGPKYTFYRDLDAGRVAAAGVQFQLPIGSANAYQNTGDLSVVPYASFAQTLLNSPIGTFNFLSTAGYAFSINRDRSDYLFGSAHVSLDVANKQTFFPLVELNWMQYTANGRSNVLKGEGRDVMNFGSLGQGSGLATIALGGRYRFSRHIELGAAYEFPLAGNRDFFRNRGTIDLIFRY